ncbi:MAG TPA: four-helix bundle copper-binding protein, partial [Gammaproteobacteria bacterium]|nr:four-helix bundle copper-binding protein [Gammaproteobacteria bacterium]
LCEQCAAECIRMDMTGMARCIEMCLDCTDSCLLSARYMSRNSFLHPRACSLSADACQVCMTECERMANEHEGRAADILKQCADACRRCGELCRQIGMLPS